MRCPLCDADDTRVIDSRPAEAGAAIRRRRECEACASRFTTYERPAQTIVVIKRDGRREPFRADKVRMGVVRALTDRPVTSGQVDDMVKRVEAFAAAQGGEVSSDDIGRDVLDALRQIDQVAYLRFASVYKDFQAAEDFEREVAALEGEALTGGD